MAVSAGPRATGTASTRILDALQKLEPDETLLIQSGKPVGVFRTHADAPRVLLANSNLVPHWATWEHFHELDRKGLMMYGQMTAGSWIYIGSQGIVQGTYETFVEMGRQHFGGDLRASGFSPAVLAAWVARSRWRPPWRVPPCSQWSAMKRASTSGCARAMWIARPRRSMKRWPSSMPRTRKVRQFQWVCWAMRPTCLPKSCSA